MAFTIDFLHTKGKGHLEETLKIHQRLGDTLQQALDAGLATSKGQELLGTANGQCGRLRNRLHDLHITTRKIKKALGQHAK